MPQILRLLVTLLTTLALSAVVRAAEVPIQKLAADLAPLVEITSGQRDSFHLAVQLNVPIDGKLQEIDVTLNWAASGDYRFAAHQSDYSFFLERTKKQTRFGLPHHKVIFIGKGAVSAEDHLAAKGIIARLISPDSTYANHLKLTGIRDSAAIAALLVSFVQSSYNEVDQVWTIDKKITASFSEQGTVGEISESDQTGKTQFRVSYRISDTIPIETSEEEQEFKVVSLSRAEIERQLARGVRRATEILSPGAGLTQPKQEQRVVPNGKLIWNEGQRVCILSGTPEEIGQAHGALLKEEALKTIDSVLYTFGTANTIRTGRWFRHDLEAAYKQLSPHIPEDHKRETAALASALEIDEQLAQTINVFPELFHCSGFAVFGSATKDGKLYHGRVLDYMTTIGLQDAATNFIISVDGKISFANVGYAGFIGSVTGMNEKAISLGEMGGRGEGKWDGVPMATLMRRALEECSSLQQVMTFWETSPRTCEYYYVFADGKTNQAVGVAATPEEIEFIQPGQGHERLGDGITDAVVLSAGSRLEKLRERVQAKHGEIDLQTAIWLMSRPVAMKSNLHNALFVPLDGVLYVANADHKQPAAERPYVRIDLKELLKENVKLPQVSLQNSSAE